MLVAFMLLLRVSVLVIGKFFLFNMTKKWLMMLFAAGVLSVNPKLFIELLNLNFFNMQVNVFLAFIEHVFQRLVCAMRSLGSMPSECMNHAHPQGEHTRLSAYGQCSKRDRLLKPRKSRALINQNAACFACVPFPYTDKSIPLNRFVDGLCFNCLFYFYCDDKDKQCLSVNIVDYEKN